MPAQDAISFDRVQLCRCHYAGGSVQLDQLGRLSQVDRAGTCYLNIAAEVADHLPLGLLAGWSEASVSLTV